MVTNFANKLSFEQKKVIFIEKEYVLKTDHKTGLLLQELFNQKGDADQDVKMLKLVLGEKQYKELMQELEEAGAEKGAENYAENIQVIAIAIMATLYNKDYDEIEREVKKTQGKN